jgi:hypothetical protein
LTRRELRTIERAIYRSCQIRIVPYDEWMLAAHFQLQLGMALAASRRSQAAGSDGSRHAHTSDTPILKQEVADGLARAHNQIENA